MVLGQRYNPIQTFTPKCANQPFAQRISLGAVNRRLYDFKAETGYRRIESKGEDGVVVMEYKPVGMARRYGFAQLSEGPGCTGMGRRVDVNHSATGMFHHHEHIKNSKSGGRCDVEITGDNGVSVILEKRRPTLIAARPSACCRRLWQILPNRARRHAQAELQHQLVRDPLLAPRWVIAGHLANQMLEIQRNPRPAGSEFPNATRPASSIITLGVVMCVAAALTSLKARSKGADS